MYKKTKIIFSFFLLAALTSCGSLSRYIEGQKRLSEAVQNKTYDLSLTEAKSEIIKYFGGWRQINPNEKLKRIREEIDKGFVYQKEYFQKYEPGLIELFTSITSEEKDSIQKYFTQTNYHTLEDTKNSFKFIFDGMLFTGKEIEPNKVKIQIKTFYDIERGPYQLSVNWLALLNKYEGLFSIRRGPILLDKSMKHAKRDQIAEIDLFKQITPDEYKRIYEGN